MTEVLMSCTSLFWWILTKIIVTSHLTRPKGCPSVVCFTLFITVWQTELFFPPGNCVLSWLCDFISLRIYFLFPISLASCLQAPLLCHSCPSWCVLFQHDLSSHSAYYSLESQFQLHSLWPRLTGLWTPEPGSAQLLTYSIFPLNHDAFHPSFSWKYTSKNQWILLRLENPPILERSLLKYLYFPLLIIFIKHIIFSWLFRNICQWLYYPGIWWCFLWKS